MDKKLYDINSEQLIIRDHLAADRTALANERTFLAYIRTALAFVAGGIGLMKLFDDTFALVVIGWLFIPIGLGILIFGTYRFIKSRMIIRKLQSFNALKEKEE
jgi:putative membrane protein